MKRFIIATLICLLGFSGTAGEKAHAAGEQKVFVVMSGNAYAYHKTRTCSAVQRATHPVKEVTLKEAQEKMHRKPCGICYK